MKEQYQTTVEIQDDGWIKLKNGIFIGKLIDIALHTVVNIDRIDSLDEDPGKWDQGEEND